MGNKASIAKKHTTAMNLSIAKVRYAAKKRTTKRKATMTSMERVTIVQNQRGATLKKPSNVSSQHCSFMSAAFNKMYLSIRSLVRS